MDAKAMNFYSSGEDIIRADTSNDALRVKEVMLGINERWVRDYDISNYDIHNSTWELNLIEDGRVLGMVNNGIVIHENKSIGFTTYFPISNLTQMRQDIVSGKTFFKDGSRAKKLSISVASSYSPNMSFWVDSDLCVWATFDTDKEAVEWLLKQ